MIKPYPSDKIYESSNVNKCAKKFYQILKQDNEKYNFFIIKNIENNDFYKFQIGNNNLNNYIVGGGNTETKIEEKKSDKELINRIENLESRVTKLEKKEIKEIKDDNESDKSNKSDKSDKSNKSEGIKPIRGLIAPPKNENNMCIIA